MINNKGTIYLIQPAELVGTKRYKIGCSAKNDLERCKKGYKKGTRFMDIRECNDPFALEQEVKTCFNSKFNLIAGKEYFEGNEADIKKAFNDVVSKFNLLKSYDFENNLTTKEKQLKNILNENNTINQALCKDDELFLKEKQIKLKKSNYNNLTCKNCDKVYNDRTGLWRHKKKCDIINLQKKQMTEPVADKELIMMLIQDNNELRKMIMKQQSLILENNKTVLEICKNGIHNTNNTHTNTN